MSDKVIVRFARKRIEELQRELADMRSIVAVYEARDIPEPPVYLWPERLDFPAPMIEYRH
jgi:hypothetical protein